MTKTETDTERSKERFQSKSCNNVKSSHMSRKFTNVYKGNSSCLKL